MAPPAIVKIKQILRTPQLQLATASLPVVIGVISALMQLGDLLKHPLPIFKKDFIEHYDFIVVGGGSAGSAIAARLSENPLISVLLLEAGGNPNPVTLVPAATPNLVTPSTAFQYSTVPQENAAFASRGRSVEWPRGKGLGGGSNINFMTYNRGNALDFDRWAEITGDPRWSFSSVLRYFLRLEDYHGYWDDHLGNDGYHSKGGPLRIEGPGFTPAIEHILSAATEKGYLIRDANKIQTPGFSPVDFTQARGTRFSTYRAYLKGIERHRRNLKILRYSQVSRIIFNHDHEGHHLRAVGVTYRRHGVPYHAGATKEVILSAGSIASPQLLMLSGIGPKGHLTEFGIPTLVDLPGVGNNLMDHVTTWVGPFIVKKGASYIPERDLGLQQMANYLVTGTGPLSTPMGVTAFGMTHIPMPDSHPNWPNVLWSVHALGVHQGLAQGLADTYNTSPRYFRRFLKKYRGLDAHFMMQVLALPRSTGYLRLRSPHIETFPEINPRYYSDPGDQDVQTMVKGIFEFLDLYENSTSLGLELGAHLAPEPIPGCEGHFFRSWGYWECVVRTLTGTLFHPAGTCAMGKPGHPGTVVDSHLRVQGVKGLRVADCSVMPKLTNANTNAPAIMIGEMCSDLIKAEWDI